MDKPPAQHGQLGSNGPISPPLTPALTVVDDTTHANGNETSSSFASGCNRQAEPSELRSRTSSSSSSSSRSNSSNSTSIRRSTTSPAPGAAASTFTATSYGDSQTPEPARRMDSPPAYAAHVHDDDDDDNGGVACNDVPKPPHFLRGRRPRARMYTDGRQEKRAFPRLSKPVELLRGEYDVVVVGSGYGGGVAASRMARTGQSVCVLERGHERWPGEYPSNTVEALKELHYSGTLAPGVLKGKLVEGGDPTGMFHLILGRGQSAVVGNGEFFCCVVAVLCGEVGSSGGCR